MTGFNPDTEFDLAWLAQTDDVLDRLIAAQAADPHTTPDVITVLLQPLLTKPFHMAALLATAVARLGQK